MHRYHQLSPQQSRIIQDCETERPGSGCFNEYDAHGVYICRRCDLPLYFSDQKFRCGCGWPSFDGFIEPNVINRPDRDQERTEILCRRCSGHLGHLFFNEGLTSTNRRHCVNSASLSFEPSCTVDGHKRAFVAGGCFWGVDHLFKSLEGVIAVSSGYMGGDVVNPTYEEICSGGTGHAEAVEVIYSNRLSYEDLLKFFLEIHNPNQRDGQGPDIGTQYRSAIFCFDEKERATAFKLLQELRSNGYSPVTEILAATHFYKAEQYHQDYYAKSGKAPYCHKKVARFQPR